MSKHTEKFNEFHAAYPEVYENFKRFAFEKIAQGFKHYSAQSILERVRWETEAGADLFTTGEPFKINNNYTAEYSRKFTADNPRFEGFFRQRRQRS